LGPILFARRLSDGPGGAFAREAWRLTTGAGALFLLGVAVVVALAPRLPLQGLPLSLGLPTISFAAAVVVGSFTQLRMAELQGGGASRQVLIVLGLGAVLSAALFYFGARNFGAAGLMTAWLIKSSVELALMTWAARRGPSLASARAI